MKKESVIITLIRMGDLFTSRPLSSFSFNNLERKKTVTLAFSTKVSNFWLETLVLNFAFAKLPQSPYTRPNSDEVTSNFRLSGHNSKTSKEIDVKLGPVTKLDKRNMETSKNLSMTSCQQIVTSFLSFKFIANLGKFGSQIPDAWSAILTFSLIVTFYLTRNWKQY